MCSMALFEHRWFPWPGIVFHNIANCATTRGSERKTAKVSTTDHGFFRNHLDKISVLGYAPVKVNPRPPPPPPPNPGKAGTLAEQKPIVDSQNCPGTRGLGRELLLRYLELQRDWDELRRQPKWRRETSVLVHLFYP